MSSGHYSGFLIAIEGIDGAGKTTQSHFLQSALIDRKIPTIRTKEPTTGKYGQILRDSALTGRLSAEEEVEVFIKDRKEHIETKIDPALKEGKVVIVDRYYFSTAAYQGCRGLDPVELLSANEAFAPEPDLLIVLDIDPQLGLQRIRTRGDRANLFEQTSTLTKARQIFNSINRPYKFVIDGSLPSETVQEIILKEVLWRIEAKRTAANAAAVFAQQNVSK
jgi:dTMP kinase